MRPIYFFSLLCIVCACVPSNNSKIPADILFKNGIIIDGTGKEAYVGNIAIKGDSVVWMGSDLSSIIADSTIDCTDMVISPGFIDAHAHGSLKSINQFTAFLNQGITTIALGQDGDSMNPLEWEKYKTEINQSHPAVNVLSFIGHASLREAAGVELDKVPSDVQLDEMKLILDETIKSGAFGITTGLEYIPGYYAQPNELVELSKTVGDNNGLMMSHVRNEDDNQIENSLRELINYGQYCRVQVSHIKDVYGKGTHRAEELLNLLDSARKIGVDIRADIYPYSASYTGIGILFPDWALPPNNYKEVIKSRRGELSAYLLNRVNSRNGPEATLFGSEPWAGKTLKQVADSLHLSFTDLLIDRIGPSGTSAAYFVMDDELQERLIQYPFTMVCTDGSPTMHHPRGYGSFAKIIREYVYEKELFSLEMAINKMTGLTAESLKLNKRGVLNVGMKADILIFYPEEVVDRATFEHPHELATGFQYILVNGAFAELHKKEIIGSGVFIEKSNE